VLNDAVLSAITKKVERGTVVISDVCINDNHDNILKVNEGEEVKISCNINFSEEVLVGCALLEEKDFQYVYLTPANIGHMDNQIISFKFKISNNSRIVMNVISYSGQKVLRWNCIVSGE